MVDSKGKEKMPTQLDTILALEHEIAYYTQCQLKAISFTKQDDGWRIMIKVLDRKDRKMVSFTWAPTIEDGLFLVQQALTTTSVSLKWKPDQY